MIIGGTTVLLIAFLYWAHLSKPAGHEAFTGGYCDQPSKDIDGLRVISYNIAYGHGPIDYAGATADRQTVESYLDRIVGLIEEKNADIALLQEVDLASRRTDYVDEAKYLSEKTDLKCYACVTTWKKNYIPFPYWPPSGHLGRMKSGQCILSRFPISDNERTALPQRGDKPFFYTAFYLDRAIQKAKVLIAGRAYDVFNVHLEAFDIENRVEQAGILARLLNDVKGTVIAGGDFNTLPPHSTVKKNFPDRPEVQWPEWQDVTSDHTMEHFIGATPHLVEAIAHETPEDQTFTFPSDRPNRRVDYIFFSRDMNIREGRVLTEAEGVSDHLPVYAKFELSH